MEELYPVREAERFGVQAEWLGPADKFEHGVDTRIAVYKGVQTVELWCNACPSRFYEIRVLPLQISKDETTPGYSLTTGSSMLKQAVNICQMIAEGMLGLGRR